MKIENSVALVTGANRGIGRSLVSALLQAGAKRIYATARDPRTLDGVVAQDPSRILPLGLDVTSPADVERAAKQAGDVTLLVNNAGVLKSFNLLSTPAETIEKDFATNVVGTLAVTRAFVPALSRAGGGAIVNVLSIVSLASMPAIGGYSASKAAAYSMTQALRGELSAKGISVHGVFAGPVDTDMIKGFEMTKTSPDVVARAILEGVSRGEEDIVPDAMSREMFALWLKNPKQVEKQFGAM